MKIKCEDCSKIHEITYDNIIFDSEDEEIFVSYLAAEMTKSENDFTE